MTTIGVAIPSIPPRARMLARALASVTNQTRLPDAISVVIDHEGHGAAWARNRAWRQLDTDLVAFLDDDDELGHIHLEHLERCMAENEADMVHSYFDVVGGTDPFPHNFGRQFDPADPHQTTITCLWRRDALERIGGFVEPVGEWADSEGNRKGEDLIAVQMLAEQGGRIVHLPERTWIWHHHAHPGNLSGVSWRKVLA